jgi:hypothetical protein
MIFISERGLEAQVSKFQSFQASMLPERVTGRAGFKVTGGIRGCAQSLPGTKKKSPAKASDRNPETLKP